MNGRPEDCILAVRRSIHIKAAPERVWEEFSSFSRMNAWWGHRVGEPRAGTHKGQWLDVYEPRAGGHIEMAGNWDGARGSFGGEIQIFEPPTGLMFANDWLPHPGSL